MKYEKILHKKQPYSLDDLRFLAANARSEFNRIFTENPVEAVLFIENFIDRFPQQRHLAREIAYLARNDGVASIYKRLTKTFLDVTEKLVTIGRATYNLPPIFENVYSIRSIGEIVAQSAMVRQSMTLGLLDTKPILTLPQGRDSYRLVNMGLLPYLADTFDITSDEKEISYFTKMSEIVPYHGQLIKVTNDIYGGDWEVIPTLYTLLSKIGKRPFAFELLEETTDIATKFLTTNGFDLNKPFVTLHLRSEGYSDSPNYAWRNANVEDYELAIEWLLNQGIQIIRIGHARMPPIKNRRGLIDLTQIQRPGEVDIYLCAKNLFFLEPTVDLIQLHNILEHLCLFPR
ncbi:MAG: hypothetical protein CMJ78_01090 [Planctomycetaceae bacterium]|nr:hypothetical protein [Planctomycetaceae bacterium]